ncbi:hypothetical protein FPZ24_07185 [Sphingomonas panacisoli]|uniref:Uncharacterized protein n=1 Tax=Sphingomonas panacisoli TaxID=1813879 RepID=A0A5B8LHF3_9SPHN|nr:hypothetical protein [Sphingomonas panacisoli]QDZ07286.1 hypothetical protein FPZ24_07185 [Sphingomonas panacisoli]
MTSAVGPDYRHISKEAVPGGVLDLGAARLKWYVLAPDDRRVTDAVARDAQDFLRKAQADERLGLGDDLGFVILHRCGDSFYFLLLSVWRGANELWEAVYYRDAGMSGFAPFDAAYPASGVRPTFCVWEMGIVAAESMAWTQYLRSSRTDDDRRIWAETCFAGTV